VKQKISAAELLCKFTFLMQDAAQRSAARPAPGPARGGSFRAKACRRIRHALALGAEFDQHSVKA
jgi:hypothetical protein